MKKIRRNTGRSKKNNRIRVETIDARAVLEDVGIEYKESGADVSEGWVGVNCPFCSDPLFHLGINLERKTISCWRCGTTGTILKYLSEKLGSFQAALEVCGKHASRILTHYTDYIPTKKPVSVELPINTSPHPSPYHIHYIEKIRRFSIEDLCTKYNLQFTGPDSNWPNKIIVPVTYNYQLITFTSIDISENAKIRYRHESKERSIIPIRNWLYGIEFTNKYSVVVVEGIFDMWRIGDGAVCLFGARATHSQLNLLSSYSHVILALDPDDAGRRGAEKIASLLSAFTKVTILDLPENTDPDTLSKKQIQEIRNLL